MSPPESQLAKMYTLVYREAARLLGTPHHLHTLLSFNDDEVYVLERRVAQRPEKFQMMHRNRLHHLVIVNGQEDPY